MGMEFAEFSVSGLGLGLKWNATTSSKKMAQDVLDRLADRRILSKDLNLSRPVLDVVPCFGSAMECRAFLGEAMARAKVGSPLRGRLRAMQSAFTAFVQAAGNDGTAFVEDVDRFRAALQTLQAEVATVATSIAEIRGVTGPPELQP